MEKVIISGFSPEEQYAQIELCLIAVIQATGADADDVLFAKVESLIRLIRVGMGLPVTVSD